MKSPTKKVRAGAQASVVVAVEGHPHVLHVDQGLARRLAHDLDGVLVPQEVAALHRVVGVVFPLVAPVGEGGVDASLGGAGVAAHRVDLADYRRVGSVGVGGNGGAHSGQPGADHQDIVLQHIFTVVSSVPWGINPPVRPA